MNGSAAPQGHQAPGLESRPKCLGAPAPPQSDVHGAKRGPSPPLPPEPRPSVAIYQGMGLNSSSGLPDAARMPVMSTGRMATATAATTDSVPTSEV